MYWPFITINYSNSVLVTGTKPFPLYTLTDTLDSTNDVTV